MAFKTVERKKAKLRLALSGPSGSGKTYSSLLIAFGIVKEWEKIGVIDTEHGSSNLYSHFGKFANNEIKPPFLVDKYIKAIKEAEEAKLEILIIDSITHAWAGEGGLLEQKTNLDARGGNQFTNWKKPSHDHQRFLNALLQTSLHLIVTMRSKTEYVMNENAGGKKVPQKVGMAPIQRDGVEYEFTTLFDIGIDHNAVVGKDRTQLFPSETPLKLSKETGRLLIDWLNKGEDLENVETPPPEKQPEPAPEEPQMAPKGTNFEFAGIMKPYKDAMPDNDYKAVLKEFGFCSSRDVPKQDSAKQKDIYRAMLKKMGLTLQDMKDLCVARVVDQEEISKYTGLCGKEKFMELTIAEKKALKDHIESLANF